VQRSDFARAYLLSRHGGLYMDLDCVVMRDLDQLFDLAEEHQFVGYRDPSGYVSNSFMAAVAGGAVVEDLYALVRATLRAGVPKDWLALSSAPLSAAVVRHPRGHALLPTRTVMPLAWQDTIALATERDDVEHERHLDAEALCYMLSNSTIHTHRQTAALAAQPAETLRVGRSFLSFLLRRALAAPTLPSSLEAPVGHEDGALP
jgi:hypothetical protein